MAAAYYGHSGVVRRLLELGADHTAVATDGPWKGKTALELAEARGKEEAADVQLMWFARQRMAFVGGIHTRLGAGSPLWDLPLDVLRLVGEACLAAENEKALRKAAAELG